MFRSVSSYLVHIYHAIYSKSIIIDTSCFLVSIGWRCFYMSESGCHFGILLTWNKESKWFKLNEAFAKYPAEFFSSRITCLSWLRFDRGFHFLYKIFSQRARRAGLMLGERWIRVTREEGPVIDGKLNGRMDGGLTAGVL